MTIRDLITQLEDLADDYGDGIEVRLAQQPSYPFEYSIGEVVVADHGVAPTAYIGEGSQLGYLPGVASRELGWR